MIRDIEKLILREIGAVSRCIYSIGDIKYKDKNLQRGQFIFLLRICENQGINLIELSNLMKVDKTTSTKAVQKLINEGYLEKKEDSLDRRVWRVYPTLKGQEVYRYIAHEEEKSSEIYYKDFSKKEKEDLFILLEKIKKNIEGTWNEIKKPKSSKK